MSKLIPYQCPHCQRRVYEWDDEAAPRFCGHCGYDSEADPSAPPLAEQLAAPYISSSAARSVDQITRAHEEGAEFRARMAQEQFGLTAEEASVIKMTNQKDNLREGDVAAAPVVVPPDMQPMRATQAGLAASGLVRQGPEPNMGLRTMMAGRQAHMQNADPRHAGSVSSELPALEVFSPMYSPRVGGTAPGVHRNPPRRRMP